MLAGSVKAVQDTTGHASADMLVNTYAHTQQSSRVEFGKKFESGFYAKPDTSSPQAVPAAGEPTISMTAHLIQKRALIVMQYSALHHRTWKTPTVQKPCTYSRTN